MNALAPCWAFKDFCTHVPSHGWIHDYLSYATQCTDAPPMYHMIVAPALGGLAISPEHDCVVDGEHIPIHMFFLIAGESGSRKSAAIKRGLRVVQPCLAETGLDHRIWYPEACTPEGIIDAMQTDPNRLMVLTEWSDLQGQGKAGYWQHAPQFWEMIYDQTPIQRLKMQKPVKIDRPNITILGASTPSLIKQNTSLRDWEAGKLARYLIGYMEKPEDREMVNAVEHAELLPDLRRRYSELLAPSHGTSFVPSPEAKAYKDTWQYSPDWKDFVRRLPEHLKPSGLRAGDHVWRLAAIYQASMDYPWNLTIGVEAVASAIQMVWWCMENLRDAFLTLPAQGGPLQRTRAVVRAAGVGGIRRDELLRRIDVHGPELDRSILTLVERKELQVSRGFRGVIYSYLYPVQQTTNVVGSETPDE